MIDKFCVIIDDEQQDEVIEDLIHRAKGFQIDLECVQLNPHVAKFQKQLNGPGDVPEIVIDLEKLIEELETPTYLRRRVDVLVCDFNLEDPYVNGFEIIRVLKTRRAFRKAIVLYSAIIDEVIEGFVKDEATRIQQLRSLIKAEISDFCDKDYSESVLKVLRKDRFSLQTEIEILLDKYSDWTFRSPFPEFQGKAIREILEEIRTESAKGVAFQRTILINAIAHMIDLNREINE